MAKSILQDKKECFLTGATYDLHEHHVFFGTGNRKISEKYGLKVWLRADLHNMSDEGVHFNKELDLQLKRMAQEKAMEHYGWSVEEFIKIIGRSHI